MTSFSVVRRDRQQMLLTAELEDNFAHQLALLTSYSYVCLVVE